MTRDHLNVSAAQIATLTANAYSADLYGVKRWTEAAQIMIDRGFNLVEIDAVLRSKHMRWYRDANPIFSEKTFIRYLADNVGGIERLNLINGY